MKKIIVVFFACAFWSASLLAQSDFSRADVYISYSEKALGPSLELAANNHLFNYFKLTYSVGYYQDFKNVAYQASIGLAYAYKDWLIIGLRGGAKKGPNWPFISSQLWLGNSRTSIFASVDTGINSDTYCLYKLSLSHNFSDNLNLGLVAWRFRGVGPIIRYGFDNFNTSIFIFPSYDFNDKVVKISFGLSADISVEALRRPLY
jgi:hypothetical protein